MDLVWVRLPFLWSLFFSLVIIGIGNFGDGKKYKKNERGGLGAPRHLILFISRSD